MLLGLCLSVQLLCPLFTAYTFFGGLLSTVYRMLNLR